MHRLKWAVLGGLLFGFANVGLAEDFGHSAAHDPVFRHRSGGFFYQHDRQRYYGAYDYRHHDHYDHYPAYGYGFGMPTYHWGWFGAHHRPRRVLHGGYYDDMRQATYRRGY